MRIIQPDTDEARSSRYEILDEEGYNTKQVYLNIPEHRAYSIIRLGKDIGLTPSEVLKEMKENNIKGSHMRNGAKAYALEQKGYTIHGNSDSFMTKFKKKIKKKKTFNGATINELPWQKIRLTPKIPITSSADFTSVLD